ncbi:hypothetical protein [Cryobacterium sp. TMT2-23]|uniref:hypothetical protein n=1 Tax=Cryobacterium sp. TMT2-23 TaxID=1259252 RepID=UPI00106D9918|nr:hypothetical protein [Cryobacterium sp. TMT2-23]TFD17785.1 hypothetical protein E3T32_13515 [Cryobacterium sp. TMT2-23]
MERLSRRGHNASGISIRSALPVLAFVVFAVALGLAAAATELSVTIVCGSVALASYLSGLLALLFSRDKYFGLFEMKLGAWFLAYAILAFGLATMTITQPQLGAGAMVDKTKVPLSLVLIGLTFTTWALGYLLGQAKLLQQPVRWGQSLLSARLSAELRKPWAIVLVFGVGIAADVVTVLSTGQYGYLGDGPQVSVDSAVWYAQPLVIASSMKFVALFGLSSRVFILRKDRFTSFLLPLLAVTVGLGLLAGAKENFVIALVSVGVPYLLSGARWRMASIIGMLLVFLFVVTPIVTAFRQDVRNSSGALDVQSAIALGVDKIFSSGSYLSEGTGSAGARSTVERIRLIDNLALIIGRTPSEIPYRTLDEVVAAPVAGLVPRLLWANKPVRLSGNEFYRTYYGGVSESSSAITLQGSLYLYGGAWILIVGMLLVGLLQRMLDDVLNARNSLIGALFFTMLFTTVVKQEMDISGFLAVLVPLTISWVLGAILLFKRRTP